jgi:ferritin-like metal-binding protein YciE
MSTITNLQELYVEQLKDLYNAETQLIKALPKMAKAAQAEELKMAFTNHLAETEEHAEKVKSVLEGLDEKASGKKCAAMEGLVKEGKETISEKAAPEVKDAALIAAAQRVEHYEIAGYGTVRTYAELLGRKQDARILQSILDQEGTADKKLTGIAEELNVEAMEEALV